MPCGTILGAADPKKVHPTGPTPKLHPLTRSVCVDEELASGKRPSIEYLMNHFGKGKTPCSSFTQSILFSPMHFCFAPKIC
jgi:hypothetical protein